MDTAKIRVRFAPSPTGLLHVGNARTALYNWLFARQHGGALILRIEDTDLERSEPHYETRLMQDLRWLGLEWDEGPGEKGERGDKAKNKGKFGPYRQSERLPLYHSYAQKLLESGKAYRCFCTVADLEAERRTFASKHLPQVYSGRCRKLSLGQIRKNVAAGMPFAIRLRLGDEPLQFHDLVRGAVEFPAEAVSDPILVRSGKEGDLGLPVYNYVVAVDDALMHITHVIRGDDHLANTPKQLAICQAFGWEPPQFAHLSAILGADHERLSKRHGAASVAGFRERGYLPEALDNYLALLGWGAVDGKTEIFSMPELIEAFSLERAASSPAVFDFDKLDWFNRHSLRAASPVRLASLAWEYFGGLLPAKDDASDEVLVWFVHVIQVFASTVDHLDQLAAKTLFLFGFDPEPVRAQAENAAVLAADSAGTVLGELAARLRAHHDAVTPALFKGWMDEIGEAAGIRGKELDQPARIALSGTYAGPEFDKLIPLIERGAALRIGIPSVKQRVERFVGV